MSSLSTAATCRLCWSTVCPHGPGSTAAEALFVGTASPVPGSAAISQEAAPPSVVARLRRDKRRLSSVPLPQTGKRSRREGVHFISRSVHDAAAAAAAQQLPGKTPTMTLLEKHNESSAV